MTLDELKTVSKTTRGAKITVKCKSCSAPFQARVADRKRGWGLYCSKRCKAIRQTQRTGYAGPRHDCEGPGWDAHKRELL